MCVHGVPVIMDHPDVDDAAGQLVFIDQKLVQLSASLSALDGTHRRRCGARYDHPTTFRDSMPSAAERLLLSKAQRLVCEQGQWRRLRQHAARRFAARVTDARAIADPMCWEAQSKEASWAVRLIEGDGSSAEVRNPSRASIRLGSRRPFCLCGRCPKCVHGVRSLAWEPGVGDADSGSELDPDAGDELAEDAWGALVTTPSLADNVTWPDRYQRTPHERLVEGTRELLEQDWSERPPGPQALRSLNAVPWTGRKTMTFHKENRQSETRFGMCSPGAALAAKRQQS